MVNLLIIDDNQKNIQLAANILTNNTNYKVLFALDGQSGLTVLRQHDIALILLDINMPIIDGFEVANEIKKDPDLKRIPIIFLTAQNDLESIEKAFECQCNDYITKPFNSKELLLRVRTHVDLFVAERKLQNNLDVSQYLLTQYKEVIDQSNLVFKIDDQGLLSYVNDLFCKVSQYSRDELIGKDATMVIGEKHIGEITKRLQKSESWKGRISSKRKDGIKYIYDALILTIENKLGTLSEYICAGIDKTEELIAKEELQELNTSLEKRILYEVSKNKHKDLMLFKQSRHAMMGEMISMIAHQWRQPLTTISTIGSGIKLDIALGKCENSQLDQKIDNISNTVQYLSSTINDFRKFFTKDKALTKVFMKDLLEQCIALVAPALEADNIKVLLDFQDNETCFETYSNELKQAILNIIKNSQDALFMNNIKLPTIRMQSTLTDTHIILHIEDNGGGIDDDTVDKIFDPYFTTKDEKNGTGLGLYMTKIIVEEHCQGRLKVSNGDLGACFDIELPRSQ